MKKADRSGLHERIIEAVAELGWSSYAEIARHITPIADAHGRNIPYNQTVIGVKELIAMGKLRYRRPPLAGHRAEIGLSETQSMFSEDL